MFQCLGCYFILTGKCMTHRHCPLMLIILQEGRAEINGCHYSQIKFLSYRSNINAIVLWVQRNYSHSQCNICVVHNLYIGRSAVNARLKSLFCTCHQHHSLPQCIMCVGPSAINVRLNPLLCTAYRHYLSLPYILYVHSLLV